MSSSADRLVVRSRLAPWLVVLSVCFAVGAAALAVTADRAVERLTLLPAVVLGLALATRATRMRIVADPEGLTARQLGSTRRYLWTQIAELGTRDHVVIAARLTDAREVGLLHVRGLSDTSTDQVARELDAWSRRYRRTGAAPAPPEAPRRPPRSAVLGLAAVLVVGSVTYAVWSGHWGGLASGMVAVLMGRYLRSGPGHDTGFRPVPAPPGGVDTRDGSPTGGGPGSDPAGDAAD